MSVLHKDVLKQLIPVDLGEDHDKVLEVAGKHFDEVAGLIDQLLLEIIPATTTELIGRWEAMVKVSPGTNESIDQRRDRVISKLRAKGGLSKAYFIAVAAALGYTISIETYPLFVCGRSRCGQKLRSQESAWQWKVTGVSRTSYAFICGKSRCGQRLGSFPSGLQAIFEKLKPANTALIFDYEE